MGLLRGIFVLAFAMLLVFNPSKRADACSCVPFSPTEKVARSDAIFTARVVSTESLNLYRWPERIIGAVTNRHAFTLGRAQLRVDRVYKGDLRRTQWVDGYGNGASCGAELEKGRTYTLFASMEASGYLEAGSCNGVFEGFDAAEYGLGESTQPLPGADRNIGDRTAAVIVLAGMLPTLALAVLLVAGTRRLVALVWSRLIALNRP